MTQRYEFTVKQLLTFNDIWVTLRMTRYITDVEYLLEKRTASVYRVIFKQTAKLVLSYPKKQFAQCFILIFSGIIVAQ